MSTSEILYAIGAGDRVVGVSSQAAVVADLIRRGLTVLTLTQRSLGEIFQAILLVGRVVGQEAGARNLVKQLEGRVAEVRHGAAMFPPRPRVYFEEWDDPMISGVQWVSDVISAA